MGSAPVVVAGSGGPGLNAAGSGTNFCNLLEIGTTAAHAGHSLSVMLIGKVIGDVVATRKHPSHEGQKILYVQVLNLDGSARGNPILAVDAADAGVGDQVLVTQEGWSAMTSVGKPFSPIDMAVIGVIDHVELE